MSCNTPSSMHRNQVQPKAAITWSTIGEDRATTLVKLDLLTTTKKVLSKEGYVFAPLTEREIWRKNRCRRCGKGLKSWTPSYSDSSLTSSRRKSDDSGGVSLTIGGQEAPDSQHNAQSTADPEHKCFFHGGRLFGGKYQCCTGHMFSQGCRSNLDHTPCGLEDVRADWHFRFTPEPVTVQPVNQQPPSVASAATQNAETQTRHGNGLPRNTPVRTSASTGRLKDIRTVVALDCEMGTSTIHTNALIKVSLVDFFTRQVLIDRLVAPTLQMAHYNTKWSGVTFKAMGHAIRNDKAIRGTEAARELIFKYVDKSTTIIMHGGSSDLIALRMIHPADKIIDTYVLERIDPSVTKHMKRGLKDVCRRRCGIEVQNARLGSGKAAGHDSLEDALAAREIVCAWLMDIPGA